MWVGGEEVATSNREALVDLAERTSYTVPQVRTGGETCACACIAPLNWGRSSGCWSGVYSGVMWMMTRMRMARRTNQF
jgi:hypothetical protein